jgi:hypothetical protein
MSVVSGLEGAAMEGEGVGSGLEGAAMEGEGVGSGLEGAAMEGEGVDVGAGAGAGADAGAVEGIMALDSSGFGWPASCLVPGRAAMKPDARSRRQRVKSRLLISSSPSISVNQPSVSSSSSSPVRVVVSLASSSVSRQLTSRRRREAAGLCVVRVSCRNVVQRDGEARRDAMRCDAMLMMLKLNMNDAEYNDVKLNMKDADADAEYNDVKRT